MTEQLSIFDTRAAASTPAGEACGPRPAAADSPRAAALAQRLAGEAPAVVREAVCRMHAEARGWSVWGSPGAEVCEVCLPKPPAVNGPAVAARNFRARY